MRMKYTVGGLILLIKCKALRRDGKCALGRLLGSLGMKTQFTSMEMVLDRQACASSSI